jgi:hypothetical protein
MEAHTGIRAAEGLREVAVPAHIVRFDSDAPKLERGANLAA